METRTYTERSNARRAARAAGLDPDTAVKPCDDGFEVCFADRSKDDHANGTPTQLPIAADRAEAEQNFAEMTNGSRYAMPSHQPAEALDELPEVLKISAEQRKAAWEKNPPRAAATKPKETIAMPKTTKKPKKERGNGTDKTATLLKMLGGKGSTVEQLTKALDWLPHTLRARISRLSKSKKDGGEGLKIERSRTDKVTTYRIA